MKSRGDEAEEVVEAARRALHDDARLGHEAAHISLACTPDGAVLVEGEVPDVAQKKRALERIAAVPGVSSVIDRLHTRPAMHMTDERVADHVCKALLQESAFAECGVWLERAGQREALHDPGESRCGAITVAVSQGVVVLDGEVPSLSHKRLAGVLAWWVPGSRDVINGLAVEPFQPDSDDELCDAVRIALEKDPLIEAPQIRVHARSDVVTLDGWVPSPEEREMAELDAWYVFGVAGVINRIQTAA